MKAASIELEDFMDWIDIISNELIEEEISSLTVGFVVRMRKWAAGSKGETTPKSSGKQLRRSSLD